ARTLGEWIAGGILAPDPEPALYLYSQQFSLPDGATRRRDGLLCRLRLEDFASGVVRPHERTLPGPKADRFAILRATGANLSAIFGLYARPGEPFVLEALDPRRRRVAGEIDCVLPARRLRLRAGPAARERLRGLPPVLRGLEVELLRRAILEPILDVRPEGLDFTHDDEEAVAAVEAGRAAVAFLLNPPSMAQVREVCLAGEV